MADVVTLGTAFVACGEGMPTPKRIITLQLETANYSNYTITLAPRQWQASELVIESSLGER